MSDNRTSIVFRVEITRVYPNNDLRAVPSYKVTDDMTSPGEQMCSLYTADVSHLAGFLSGRYGLTFVFPHMIPEPPKSLTYEITLSPWCGARLARRVPDETTQAPTEVKHNVVCLDTGLPAVLRFLKCVGRNVVGDWQRAPGVDVMCRMSGVEVLIDALSYNVPFTGWTWDMRDGCDVLVDAAGQDRFTVVR